MKRLPFVKCKGLCQDSCALAPCSATEAANLFDRPETRYDDDPLTCAWLDADGRCSTYETRPTVCRLYGVVLGMRCPHGCRPRAWPSRRDEDRWMSRYDKPEEILLLVAEGAVTPERLMEIADEVSDPGG